MTDSVAPNSFVAASPLLDASVHAVEEGHARVGLLLAGLQASSPAPDLPLPNAEAAFESQLALVRLGMATSLYYSLRTKHPPTANHCLRVAVTCSAWAIRLGLDPSTRDRLEVAALLHDLGKIGIPDRILRKPGKLTVDEQLTMDCCPQLGCEILRGCTGDSELLDIIRYSTTWFDSRRQTDGPRRNALPLGSRMLAIADAFDAMTIDSVYRPALSRERAIQELIDGSGTQFDPELALDFNRMLEERPEMLHGVVMDRWLTRLQQRDGNRLWGPGETVPTNRTHNRDLLFFEQLVSDLKDGVAFTDGEGTITHWNAVMERLTGIGADAILSQTWSDECVRLRQRDSERSDSCLVHDCLASGAIVTRPMIIEQPDAEPTPVHVQVSPVVGATRGLHGTVIVIRDMSHQADLQQQLESLHHQSKRDPLTQVANRAWFDEVLEQLVEAASNGSQSFSLIICDIDHFKRVNDVYGHPAGDEALIGFTSILSAHSREGDLVARYGGEEFLLLTPGCDNATAAKRAEAIRKALEMTPLKSIGGESVTASFGVTEYQSGDTPQTIVSRADRALLKAKDNGRNRVVQLGPGSSPVQESKESKKGWLNWFQSQDDSQQTAVDILTPVPVDLAIEKLRGFIADHHAQVIHVEKNHVSLKLVATCGQGGRRRIDRQIGLKADMSLEEIEIDPRKPLSCRQTIVHVKLQPVRNRDRRSAELSECFRQVVASLKSYLMGEIRPRDEA
jgi:diguanylate cyclase (GGDEF)-like protein/PAS domain S-box-containing protein